MIYIIKANKHNVVLVTQRRKVFDVKVDFVNVYYYILYSKGICFHFPSINNR